MTINNSDMQIYINDGVNKYSIAFLTNPDATYMAASYPPAPKTSGFSQIASNPRTQRICATCQKKFRQAEDFRRHIRIHTGERPYACTYNGCAKKFKQPGHLQDHLNRHRNNRKYLCTIDSCNTAFFQKRALDRHLKVHQNI